MTFFRTYAGTLYIAYCQHEILHTIISFFQIDITFNVSLNEAYLIFDDTVINKKYRYNIEIARRQYSGNEHQVVHGSWNS